MDYLKQQIESNNISNDEVRDIIELLDNGEIRVATFEDNQWIVHTWIKQAIMKYFGICNNKDMSTDHLFFRDKIELKSSYKNVRIVPGGSSVRFGSYLANNVIMMPPSYVNIGAFIDEGSMIDSNVLVGSCAQIGKNVHLSAGVQIGGVLEPINASPVIIEDGAFIGAGSIIVEGIRVGKDAVIAPGTIISGSTKIIEVNKEGKIIKTFTGQIPNESIVIPGARQRGDIILQSPIIIGYKSDKTNQKTALSEFLRDF